MSKLRLKFIQAWVDRDGRAHHYFRRPGFPLVRLPGMIGSAEFMAAYQQALAVAPQPIGADRSRPGTVSAAIMTYYQSRAFRTLKGGTPAMRRAILERFREAHGDKLIAAMPPKFVAAMLDSMQPHAARNWLKALRHLMAHCVATGQIAEHKNPTLGIKAKVPALRWSSLVDRGRDRRNSRRTIRSAASRGSRSRCCSTPRSDGATCSASGRQHVRGDQISVRQEKTGKPLAIPVHPALRAVLDATPCGHLTFLTSRTGRPYAPSDFSDQFRQWCDAAGLPHCSMHGLRKAACQAVGGSRRDTAPDHVGHRSQDAGDGRALHRSGRARAAGARRYGDARRKGHNGLE